MVSDTHLTVYIMNSDSESQDSDEGRRFRFATTRKDGAPQLRKESPKPRRAERRSRSKDRSSKYTDSSRRNRFSSDKDTNDKQATKDRCLRDVRSSSRDKSSRRYNEKDSRRKSHDSKDSKSSSGSKHKSKSKEKHKKRSRDRSREKSSKKNEEISKSEKRKVDFNKSEVEENNIAKKQCVEDLEKVNFKNTNKKNEYEDRDFTAILGTPVTDSVPVYKKSKSYFDRVVKKNVTNDSNYYGPTLPPKLEKAMLNARDNEKDTEKTKNNETTIKAIGPTLPALSKLSLISGDCKNDQAEKEKGTDEKEYQIEAKEEKEQGNDDNENEDENEDDAFGPALPPHLQRRKIVGPVLPDKFVSSNKQSSDENSKSDSEEDAADIVGPLPADHPANQDSYIQLQLEYRARKVKEKFMEKVRNILCNLLIFLSSM